MLLWVTRSGIAAVVLAAGCTGAPPTTAPAPGSTVPSESVAATAGASDEVLADDDCDPVVHPCVPSCAAALAFAEAGTPPDLEELVSTSSGYLRVTTAEGPEPDPDRPLDWDDAVVEMVSMYPVGQNRDGRVMRSGWQFRWHWSGRGVALAVWDGVRPDWLPRLETDFGAEAQWLATPDGCVPNPHRTADGAATAGPGRSHRAAVVGDPEAEALVLLARLMVDHCPDGARHAAALSDASVIAFSPSSVSVYDPDGLDLSVNLSERTVLLPTAPDGSVLPPYEDCDPDVFLGPRAD